MTPVLLLAGLAIVVGLAFVYQLGLEWIPLIYISFVLTAVFGGALGIIGSKIVNVGHCRNVMFAALIAFLLLGVGLVSKHYFQYRTLVSMIADAEIENAIENRMLTRDQADASRDELVAAIDSKISFLQHFKTRADIGISIGRGGQNGGGPITGTPMYILWLVEAGAIAWFGFRSPIFAAGEPYNEKMGQWTDESEQVMTLPITDDEMVARIKAATSVEQLLEIPIPKDDQSNQFAVYTVNSIVGQELEDAYLSVDLLTVTINNQGEAETAEKRLVKNAILSTENRKQLLENASLLNEAMEEYRRALAEEEAEAARAAADEAKTSESDELANG